MWVKNSYLNTWIFTGTVGLGLTVGFVGDLKPGTPAMDTSTTHTPTENVFYLPPDSVSSAMHHVAVGGDATVPIVVATQSAT